MGYQDDLEQSKNSETVAALFQRRTDVSNAIDELNEANFSNDNIGVIWHDRDKGDRLASSDHLANRHTDHTDRSDLAEEGDLPDLTPTRSDSVAEGALAGGVIGGAAGLLAGMMSLLIPGVGPFIAGGILTTVLAGAVAGGLIGALVRWGIPEDQARYYDEAVRRGEILVTVRAGSRWMEAKQILERNGGQTGIPEQPLVEVPPTTSLQI